MLIGEAPGAVENKQGKTFVGPAGRLCDRIFAAVGIDTNTDMYLGNICKCRPIATQGSGKQNYTPQVDQRTNCMPYIQREIELIDPQIIILAGLTAAKTLLGDKLIKNMGQSVGKIFKPSEGPLKGRESYVIYHPAYLIHAQKSGMATEARQKMWEHVQFLRKRVDELGIELNGVSL
jgi:DNA polymerase